MLNTATDAPTFKESLLQCMLNGICEPEKDDPDSFAKKIKYSIIWEEPEILKNVLENTGLDKAEKKDVLKEALIDAIARNNCDAVKALFGDPNASADQFDVEVRLHRNQDLGAESRERSFGDAKICRECGRMIFQDPRSWS